MAKPKKPSKKKSAKKKSIVIRRKHDEDIEEMLAQRKEEHALDMKIRAAFLDLILATTDAVKAWSANSATFAEFLRQQMDDDGDDDDEEEPQQEPYGGTIYGGLDDD